MRKMNQEQNPFLQFRPKEDISPEPIEREIMAQIQTKSYLAHILEFFTATFGLSLRESVNLQAHKDEEQAPHEPLS